MSKEKTNRSGSGRNTENKNDRRQTQQPGAPAKSNRQTKGRDESGPVEKTGTKKQANSI
ncbi:MAG TPA: hypothetical protein VGB46_09380 [Flavisolibacter sp.]|jgi:hypothetical protein